MMTSETFDTQFWRDVATGYEQVARDASLSITVERENKQAVIKSVQHLVVVMIGDAPNEKASGSGSTARARNRRQ